MSLYLARVTGTPCEKPGSYFVPRGANITFTHPDHGKVTYCFEDHEGEFGKVCYWWLGKPAFWITTLGDAKKRIKGFADRFPDAVIETNCKAWKAAFGR